MADGIWLGDWGVKQKSNVKNWQCCLYRQTWEVDVLISLGLRLWQHMIVGSLHKHCVAAEDTGYTKLFLIYRFKIWHSDPTTHFKLWRRRFRIKIAFAVTFSKAQRQTLKPAEVYPPSSVPPPPPSPAARDTLPILIWKRRFCNYCTTLTVYRRLQICDVKHCIARSAVTLIPLTWRIWWAPNNTSKWQVGFNSAF